MNILVNNILLIPVQILSSEAYWYLGYFMCVLHLAVIIIITSSVGNMVRISIEGYLAICGGWRVASAARKSETKARTLSVVVFLICHPSIFQLLTLHYM